MSRSPLGRLPRSIAAGARRAAYLLGSLAGPPPVTLQTRELVIADPAAAGFDADHGLGSDAPTDLATPPSRLIAGDGIPVMVALLAGDPPSGVASLRGGVDLVCMDLVGMDLVGVDLPGTDLPSIDLPGIARLTTWLVLVRELLAATGRLVIRLPPPIVPAVGMVLDDVFGAATEARRTEARRTAADPEPPRTSRVEVVTDAGVGAAKSHRERFLRRAIAASCPSGGLVADLGVGSGAAAEVAERLGRRWITADPAREAVAATRASLVRLGARPFLRETIAAAAAVAVSASVVGRTPIADADGQREALVVRLDPHVPLPLVESWAIDPDYDGVRFRSVWHSEQQRRAADHDPLQITAEASIAVALHDGPRTVCVRAVDVVGVESETVIELPARWH